MDKVVHFHIPVGDMVRARKFYTEIFGWEITETGMENDYSLATTVETDDVSMPKEPGAINGALYLRESDDECPAIVINVSSIYEYLQRVEGAGGRVVTKKSPVGHFGLYAEITDPEGNLVGLFQDLK
jgi:predicted enzyme related to lactoylglutathione lyase